jgi:hypothetical protein
MTVDASLLIVMSTPPSVDDQPTFDPWPPLLMAKGTSGYSLRTVTIWETF